MRLFILFGLLVLGFNAYASDRKIANCRAVEVVNKAYFGEALDVDQKAQVSIYQDEGGFGVKVGSNVYHQDRGDEIEPQPTIGFDLNFKIRQDQRFSSFSIFIRDGSMVAKDREVDGFIYGESDAKPKNGEDGLVARLKCNSPRT